MSAKDAAVARITAQEAQLLLLAARRIRSAMEEQEETYRSLAQRAGVSAGTISNLLAGKDPQLTTFLKVAAALGFPSIESVFGDIELPTRSWLTSLMAHRQAELVG